MGDATPANSSNGPPRYWIKQKSEEIGFMSYQKARWKDCTYAPIDAMWIDFQKRLHIRYTSSNPDITEPIEKTYPLDDRYDSYKDNMTVYDPFGDTVKLVVKFADGSKRCFRCASGASGYLSL